MDAMRLLLVGAGVFAVIVLVGGAMDGASPTREAARRLQALRLRHSDQAIDRVEAQLRKAVAARRPDGAPGGGALTRALKTRLQRTGRGWTIARYVQASSALALGVALVLLVKTGILLLALAIGLAAGALIPNTVVNMLISRRAAAFAMRFPDAIELLVRGLRSGLPVSETFTLIGAEVPPPVGEEFKLVSERVRIGRTMDEALQDSADRLASSEFSFFCIALAIQRETGGNLAETLSNLADVLRKRAQMALKVRAMSSEAKASAIIVSVLPFVVFALLLWANAAYLAPFFTDRRLMIVGSGCLVWMAIGGWMMAKMVKFEI